MEVRRRSLVFPREHGAWGMLLVPLVTGAAGALFVEGNWPPLAPLIIVALSLFWMRTPVESWIGSGAIRARNEREFALVRNAAAALGAVALLALAWLFWVAENRILLLEIGAAAAAAFVAQAVVRRLWPAARTVSQIIGGAGLTSLAAAAYCVVTGGIDLRGWMLWLANFLFAVNQIQYVHLRIHAARASNRREKLSAGRAFLAAQILLAAVLAIAAAGHAWSWWAAAAFLPLLVRGFAWFAAAPAPLMIHRLGQQELFQAILFGVLLVAGLQF